MTRKTKMRNKNGEQEGHCEQDGSLGGRPAGLSRDKHGRLKWGVGKIIAHAPVTPVVIPLFHTGMAHLIPINPLTRKILHAVPRTGNTVTARTGGVIRSVEKDVGSIVSLVCLSIFLSFSLFFALVAVVS